MKSSLKNILIFAIFLFQCNSSVKLKEKEAQELFEKGVQCSQIGDYAEAIQYYEESNKLRADWVTYQNLATAKKAIGEFEESLKDYNKSIELNPKNASSYYNRGNLKVLIQDYYGAIEDFDKAITLNPGFALAYRNRGVIKLNYLDDKEGGCADIYKAKELGAKGAEADIALYCN